MALTISTVKKTDLGDVQEITADVTFDSSYPVGGETITAQDLGFRVGRRIDSIDANPVKDIRFEFEKDASLDNTGKLVARGRRADDFALNRPLLAIGTAGADQVKITNPVTRSTAGIVAEEAADEVAFTDTTHDIAPDADTVEEATYLISLQAVGTYIITKGSTSSGAGTSVVPDTPSNEVALGYVVVAVEAGATPFNANTDLLSDTHLTVTFVDLDGETEASTDLSGVTTRIVARGR